MSLLPLLFTDDILAVDRVIVPDFMGEPRSLRCYRG
jgi:hypothetical protein